MAKVTEPDVYQASDFRQFLRNYYDYRRSRNPRFSYTSFARLLRLKSRSFIQLVIRGERNLGYETLEAFRPLFGDRVAAFEHFRLLVLRDQAANSEQRKQYDLKIRAERSTGPVREMKEDEYIFYTDWYFIPIFFMPLLTGFRDDPEWIRRKLAFRATLAQVKFARTKLIEHGYWIVDDDGKIRTAPPRVSSNDGLVRTLLRRFHIQMLTLGIEADRSPSPEGLLTGSTLRLSPKQLERFKEKFFKFKQTELVEFMTLEPTESEGEKVFHLGIFAFPLTK